MWPSPVSSSRRRAFRPIADIQSSWHQCAVSRLLLFVAAIGGVVSAPLRAQVDTQADAIRAMHRVAACLVFNESSISGILAVPPGSAAERALLRLATPYCTGNVIGISLVYRSQMLRGTIAEEVLRLGDNNRTNGRRMRWVAPFTALSAADVAALDERGRLALGALDLAQCVQAAAPNEVQALLNTRPTDPPEGDAFRQLSPFFGPCLEAGAQVTISRPQLRGFLAEAAYRAAFAAGTRSGSPHND